MSLCWVKSSSISQSKILKCTLDPWWVKAGLIDISCNFSFLYSRVEKRHSIVECCSILVSKKHIGFMISNVLSSMTLILYLKMIGITMDVQMLHGTYLWQLTNLITGSVDSKTRTRTILKIFIFMLLVYKWVHFSGLVSLLACLLSQVTICFNLWWGWCFQKGGLWKN